MVALHRRGSSQCVEKEKPNGSAALIRQQSMGGERLAQEERNGIRLGGSFAFHWRALYQKRATMHFIRMRFDQ